MHLTARIAWCWLGLALLAQAWPVPIPGGLYTNLFTSQGVVMVQNFYLDRYPVTNADYLEFVQAAPAWQRSRVKRLFADESYLQHWTDDLRLGAGAPSNSPVVNVSWFAARAYAKWKGQRLPTLAEWELASRPDATTTVARILAWYGRPVRGPLPAVGSTFANAQGVWDLHGLIWEWVDDFNTALVTGESRADTGLERNLFCGSGALGASSFDDYAAFMRYAFRSSLKANYTVPNLGFRCAKDLPP